MKKSIILFLILITFILTGCSKKEKMVSFIPTPVPTEGAVENTEDITQAPTQAANEATPAPKEIHVGQTTPMYVKMDEYGAYLNIRPTSSTEGAPVGFLVHAEKIEVIEIVDGWASFLYNDSVCYVNADFLVKQRPEYLEPPTPTPAPTLTPTPAPEAAAPEI